MGNSNTQCLLCNGGTETHDHLFFHCPFSKLIWDSIALKCNINTAAIPWESRICQMVGICSGKSLSSSIKKLCLAATIYSIWNERNKRFHDGSLREAKMVTWDIIELVRYRLMSSKNIQDNEENRSIQLEWRLPESVFA